jgi:hypothetical protein
VKERRESKARGVFEKVPGSRVWWIVYYDQFGKRHREKAGTKSAAIKLYGKRKQQALEGKKLSELLRRPSVNFGQLLDDALTYSKRNKRSYNTDVPRIASLKQWFGSHSAEELTPKEIENVLARTVRKRKVGSFYVQPLSVADVALLSTRNPESKGHDESGAFRHASSRRQQPCSLPER